MEIGENIFGFIFLLIMAVIGVIGKIREQRQAQERQKRLRNKRVEDLPEATRKMLYGETGRPPMATPRAAQAPVAPPREEHRQERQQEVVFAPTEQPRPAPAPARPVRRAPVQDPRRQAQEAMQRMWQQAQQRQRQEHQLQQDDLDRGVLELPRQPQQPRDQPAVGGLGITKPAGRGPVRCHGGKRHAGAFAGRRRNPSRAPTTPRL